jgi:predicted SprT family Zn-dependent metalloprotease
MRTGETKMKTNYEAIAYKLLISEGLAQKGWTFKYDNAIRRAGCCNYRKQVISLSRHYVEYNSNNEKDIMNTIIHEIAHAVAGHSAGHGLKWKAVFHDLLVKHKQPIDTSRCYSAKIKMPKSRYSIKCKSCNYEWKRNRMSRRKKEWLITKAECRFCNSSAFQIKDKGQLWVG